MARPIRIEFEGATYHVMSRGNEGRMVFLTNHDRLLFLKTLEEMLEQFGIVLYAYCLMPNHYHLVFKTCRGNLSQAMGWFQTTFTVRYNLKKRRNGHLFQGRYKAIVVDEDDYAKQLVQYIHLNPVRPRNKNDIIPLVRKKLLDQYEWSSHLDYAGLRPSPKWLCLDWLNYWGWNASGTSKKTYQSEIASFFGKPPPQLWNELRGGFVLGGESFFDRIKRKVSTKNGRDEMQWMTKLSSIETAGKTKCLLAGQKDARLKMWMRVRLGGERLVEVARDFGYKEGSGVLQAIKRLEKSAQSNPELMTQLVRLREEMSSVKS